MGLILLRLVTGAGLLRFGISGMRQDPPPWMFALQIIGVISAIFLLLGLFTPVAGALAAVATVWIAIARFSSLAGGDPWITLAQGILAITLTMIGPGAWSIDARLFGRKHIRFSDR